MCNEILFPSRLSVHIQNERSKANFLSFGPLTSSAYWFYRCTTTLPFVVHTVAPIIERLSTVFDTDGQTIKILSGRSKNETSITFNRSCQIKSQNLMTFVSISDCRPIVFSTWYIFWTPICSRYGPNCICTVFEKYWGHLSYRFVN